MCTTWSTLLFSNRSPPTHSSCVAQVFSLLKCRNTQHAPVLPCASQNSLPNETQIAPPRGSKFSRRCQSRRLRRIAETAEPSKGCWHRSDVGGCQGSVEGLAGPDDAHLFSTTRSYGRDACAGCSGKQPWTKSRFTPGRELFISSCGMKHSCSTIQISRYIARLFI